MRDPSRQPPGPPPTRKPWSVRSGCGPGLDSDVARRFQTIPDDSRRFQCSLGAAGTGGGYWGVHPPPTSPGGPGHLSLPSRAAHRPGHQQRGGCTQRTPWKRWQASADGRRRGRMGLTKMHARCSVVLLHQRKPVLASPSLSTEPARVLLAMGGAAQVLQQQAPALSWPSASAWRPSCSGLGVICIFLG